MGEQTNSTIGDLLKTTRRKAGLSQADLAAAVGYSKARISEIERGRGSPSPELAAELDRALNSGTRIRAALQAAKTEPYQITDTKALERFTVDIDLLVSAARPDQDPDSEPSDVQPGSFLHLTPTAVTFSPEKKVTAYRFGHGAVINKFHAAAEFASIADYSAWTAEFLGERLPDDDDEPLVSSTYLCTTVHRSIWPDSQTDTALELLAAPSELRRATPIIDLTGPSPEVTGSLEAEFLTKRHRVTGSIDVSCRPFAIGKATAEGVAYHPRDLDGALEPATVIDVAVQVEALRIAAHAVNTSSLARPDDPVGYGLMLAQLLNRFTAPMFNQTRHYQRLVDQLTQATRLEGTVHAAINTLNMT